ncbi:MAG: cell division protein [Sphingomonadales bacterium]|nr:cell division protein [Sphingomonadales bacterium]
MPPAPARGDGALVPQARLSGPMPWVIAIMVAMTVIAAAAALALRNVALSASAELSGGITVQIVEAGPESRARQAGSALAALRAMPDVAAVRQVPQGEVDALIEPWLGTADDGGAAIPVPALLDVRIDGGASPARVAQLAQRLHRIAPAARVDAQTTWLKPVFGAIASLQWLALALIALLGAAMAAAVLLATRTALGNHRGTIEIVHMLGGTDIQIARIFQRAMGIDAAVGAAVGTAAGVAAVLVLGSRFGALSAGLVENGALGMMDWLLLALVPLAAVGLAMVTARQSVLGAIGRML